MGAAVTRAASTALVRLSRELPEGWEVKRSPKSGYVIVSPTTQQQPRSAPSALATLASLLYWDSEDRTKYSWDAMAETINWDARPSAFKGLPAHEEFALERISQ